ncbi:MAG: Cytochrome c oxidase subunit 2 precursor [Actinomycetota bacterium]
MERSHVRTSRRLRWLAIPVVATVALVLSGCTQQELTGYLPTLPGTTNQVDRIIGLWNTSWIVLLGVGLIAWGLMIWATIVYRRRKGETGVPVQLRYNMPIEIFFTVVPLIMIVGFFFFTARDEAAIEARFDKPDVTIQAFGKQWAWDFNYTNYNVYYSGIQVQPSTDPNAPQGSIDPASIPTLYLPVGKKVEIQLQARDVIHSFWVIDFLYKKDMIPGKTNYMSVIPEREGTFRGKCAELCGEFHSQMLFNVKVVSQAEYDAYIKKLRDEGFSGQLGTEYDRNTNKAAVVAVNK